MSYDPSQWYSYSKNKPNEVPSQRRPIIEPDAEEGKSFLQEDIAKSDDSNPTEQQQLKTIEQSAISVKDFSGSDAMMPEIKQVKGEMEGEKLQMTNRRMNNFVKRLQKMARELPSAYKKKFTYDIITQLAESLIDDTVFEIVKGLEDIQQLSERNLLNRRMKLLSEEKGQRLEMTKRHQTALQECQSRPHQVKLLEREHMEEKKNMEEKLKRELNQLDQKLVLEIDQQAMDQQATLQRAGVPLFSITNKPEEVQLQMYLLDFITRLIPETCKK